MHITTVTLSEAGYPARSATDLAELLDLPPLARMPVQYMTPASENRAVEVLRSFDSSGLRWNVAPKIMTTLHHATLAGIAAWESARNTLRCAIEYHCNALILLSSIGPANVCT
ncbi:hypothetical protein AB0H00_13240 [Nocardia sp. NPDC023852]|uniref:hypothetical protein n=1 Tax=Nocardia sp. NPDC023852 TaxID=3154697 RepID=UPI0033FF1127